MLIAAQFPEGGTNLLSKHLAAVLPVLCVALQKLRVCAHHVLSTQIKLLTGLNPQDKTATSYDLLWPCMCVSQIQLAWG